VLLLRDENFPQLARRVSPSDEICRAITFLGFEVEQVIRTGAPKLSSWSSARCSPATSIPNADKLSVCTGRHRPGGRREDDRLRRAELRRRRPRARGLAGAFCRAISPSSSRRSAARVRWHDVLGQGTRRGRGCRRPPHPDRLAPHLAPRSTGCCRPVTRVRHRDHAEPPDCQSHLGIARELAAWFKLAAGLSPGKFPADTGDGAKPPRSPAVGPRRAPEDCPLYTAHIITGIKIGPSPAWMQQRLTASACARSTTSSTWAIT
jgi:phenylalanyl-tRNA synthetase beta chain